MAETPFLQVNWQIRGTARTTGFRKQGWKQSPRTDIPMTYLAQFGTVNTVKPTGGPDGLWIDTPNSFPVAVLDDSSNYQHAMNRAYGDWIEQIQGGFTSELLTFIAEGHKSLEMVTKRAMEMVRFCKKLKKKDPTKRRKFRSGKYRARSTMKQTPKQPGLPLDKRLGGWVLEWNFGWAPSIQDILNSIQALGRQFGDIPIYGRGTEVIEWSSGSNPVKRVQTKVIVKCGARQIRVVNPNLALAGALGLTNPLVTGFELVRLSFLADWAFDIQGYLGSWTDLFGYEIMYPWWNAKSNGAEVNDWTIGSDKYQSICRAVAFKRSLGIIQPLPNFHLRANLGTSVRRAANALSLLAVLR